MDPEERGPGADPSVVFQVRRTHLAAVAGCIVGLVWGFGFARLTDDEQPQVVIADPARTAGLAAGASANPATAPSTKVEIPVSGRPATGAVGAKVTMVEFVDFECPFCRAYARDVQPALERKYGGRVRFVYKHWPLRDKHPNAQAAALAAECVHQQGHFREFSARLFRREPPLTERVLRAEAKSVGVDAGAYSACLTDKQTAATVEKDVKDGEKVGVNGTPTFFIAGYRFQGTHDVANLSAELDRRLAGKP